MQTFIAAYLVVWLGVVAFLARMAIRHRRLETTLRTLRDKLSDPHHGTPSKKEAAHRSDAA